MRVMSMPDARIERFRQGIRQQVCPHCDRRAIDSDLLPADEPRTCEGRCAVFGNLPVLVEVVDSLDAPEGVAADPAEREHAIARTIDHAIKALICLRCQTAPRGSQCSNRTNARCPMVRNEPRIVRVLAGQYAQTL